MIYLIPKKSHSAKGLNFGITFKKSIRFAVCFLESALYKFPEKYTDRMDVNKIFGFSTSFYHHYQSARLGWRSLDGETIQIFPYCYVDWKLQLQYLKEPLMEVKANDILLCEITDIGEMYGFKVHNVSNNQIEFIKIPKKKDWFLFHYFLYPYFGGNLKAPHEIEIIVAK